MASHLECPQCGGENPLPSGARLLVCQFCDAALFVDRSGLVSHYRLPRLLGRGEAERSLRRWMAGNDTVKDLDKKAAAVSLTPLLFPVWMFRRRGAGGEEVFAQPAAATPEPAVADLSVPAGKLEPYRGEAGGGDGGRADGAGGPADEERVEATVPLETARGWLGQSHGEGALLETALVHVPFWRASYDFDGRTYSALVEGSTGVVLASVFPEKAEAPYFLVAALGLVLFGAEGLLIQDLFFKLLAYAVTAVPLLGLAWWVTRRV